MKKSFELNLDVEPGDIDELGHVNNVVYLRWIQDVAIAHWKSAAPAADQESLRWVVMRHEVDYKRPAYLHDKVVARTWVGVADRRNFERHTELLRQSDMRVLALARTVWCPIDAKTGRPTNVSAQVRELFSVNPSETD
ncbi:MAG: acyl-CoA thioesterase [Rhodothermales bacterium]|nr:acyl-CoA thioesterase [Rhodothermales bacterium]